MSPGKASHPAGNSSIRGGSTMVYPAINADLGAGSSVGGGRIHAPRRKLHTPRDLATGGRGEGHPQPGPVLLKFFPHVHRPAAPGRDRAGVYRGRPPRLRAGRHRNPQLIWIIFHQLAGGAKFRFAGIPSLAGHLQHGSVIRRCGVVGKPAAADAL